ncbi:MAG: 30S ribosomal protein S20 [Solirubrobacterales bacterium]
MAKSKTPAKRARVADENRDRNVSKKSAMKTAIKKFETAVAEQNIPEAQAKMIAASSVVDKNVTKGIIHKNKAARNKSRMAKKLNGIAGQA